MRAFRGRGVGSFAVALAMLLAVSACGGAGGGTSFTGIKRTYVVAGGDRVLDLNGRSGTYTAITPRGSQVLSVSLGPTTMSVGALSFPYLAENQVLIGGGYIGFSRDSVTSDPKAVPGTYTAMTGANFAGELSIDAAGNYIWCMRSAIDGSSCADGSAAKRGSTTLDPTFGFSFSGLLGVYAIFRQGSAAGIFPISTQGLRLTALTQPSGPPRGTFAQPSRNATGDSPLTTAKFTGGAIVVSGGDPAWNGTYQYVVNGGVVSFASELCPDGTCNAIYNNALGILYVARLGNGAFIR